MARGEKITQILTSSEDLAIRFLQRFLSNGEKFGDFWKVGNFQNKKGTGADGGSTTIKIPELCGSDKTTGDKVKGPIKIIRLLKGCAAPEAEEAIIEWLSSAGVEIEESVSKGKKETSETAFPWSTAVQGLTEDDLKGLRGFRGFSQELCERIKSLELIAKVEGRWAFPVRNKSGVIVAVDRLTTHPDLDPKAKKQNWQPKPVGAARNESWYYIGVDPIKASKLI